MLVRPAVLNFAPYQLLMSEELDIFPETGLTPDYQQLYKEVAAQLNKDFHPHVRMSTLPEILSSSWLYDEVKKMLTEIVEHKQQALGYIVYRVDLSENLVNRTLKQSDSHNKLDELTAMVLKREAQKVWTRRNYRAD